MLEAAQGDEFGGSCTSAERAEMGGGGGSFFLRRAATAPFSLLNESFSLLNEGSTSCISVSIF